MGYDQLQIQKKKIKLDKQISRDSRHTTAAKQLIFIMKLALELEPTSRKI
jgi:hypothetical protein